MNKDYCPTCKKEREFKVLNSRKKIVFKGREYVYIGKDAVCLKCNTCIDAGGVIDYNVRAFNTAYRKANGIITVDEIEEILKKYNIGKRPLSLLLGWGELTLSRYIEGEMPEKEYSNTLKNILISPYKYYELLTSNENKISKIAYKKSKKAVDELINNTNKLECAAKYIISKNYDVTSLSMQKLLYYIQGFSFAFNGEFVFEEEMEAWTHGPVFRKIYDIYKVFGYNELPSIGNMDVSIFSEKEMQVIDGVIEAFSLYSPLALKMMTHNESPWIKARRGKKNNESSDARINKKDIKEYFKNIKNDLNLKSPRSIDKYAYNMFKKIKG